MQARIENPALSLSGALDAFRKLGASATTVGIPRTRSAWCICARARSTGAACASTSTPANSRESSERQPRERDHQANQRRVGWPGRSVGRPGSLSIERWPTAPDAQDYVVMDDLFIPLWPPAWVEDHTLSDEQLVAAGEDVKLMSALRSDERVLLSVSWPGGRRYLMIDPAGDGAPEAFRAGATSTDSDLARAIDAMWSQALRLAKQILDGELPGLDEPPEKRRRWRRRGS
jgi:hypothetical protein